MVKKTQLPSGQTGKKLRKRVATRKLAGKLTEQRTRKNMNELNLMNIFAPNVACQYLIHSIFLPNTNTNSTTGSPTAPYNLPFHLNYLPKKKIDTLHLRLLIIP